MYFISRTRLTTNDRFIDHGIVQRSDYIPVLTHVQKSMFYEQVPERRQITSSCFESWNTLLMCQQL